MTILEQMYALIYFFYGSINELSRCFLLVEGFRLGFLGPRVRDPSPGGPSALLFTLPSSCAIMSKGWIALQ